MYSTLDDYGRFLLMNFHEGKFGVKQVLKPKTVREIIKDQTRGAKIDRSPYATQKGYGLGVATVEVDEQGRPLMIADGGAFGTYCWIDYKAGVLGVFFTAMPMATLHELVQRQIPAAARAAVLGVTK
jgi:CubicO group peptidase (beta-lactamase class C family)